VELTTAIKRGILYCLVPCCIVLIQKTSVGTGF
jgi:hypothetical protein